MQRETVMRPLRFVWGWIYVGFSALVGLFYLWLGYNGWGAVSTAMSLVAIGLGVAFLISAAGVASRRRWGWYFTLLLTGIFSLLTLVATYSLATQAPILISGYISFPAVMLVISFLLYLFFFVYFLRRKSLLR
jgi:hypothetical protein